MQVELDLVHTLAFGGLALMLGYAMRRWIPVLARYNLPPPVLGGLVVAVAVLVTHSQGEVPIKFDTTLQTPLMIAFFTTIGFGASVALLRTGGPQVLSFLIIASIFAIAQNVLGIAVATAFGLDPLFGVLAGSVTLTGGPATGLAFAPSFEAAGVPAAASVAVAAAMAGIVLGGLVGGPAATYLIGRFRLRTEESRSRTIVTTVAIAVAETETPPASERQRRGCISDLEERRRDSRGDVGRRLDQQGLRCARHYAACNDRRDARRGSDSQCGRCDRMDRLVAANH